MKVWQGLEEFKHVAEPVVTSGTFDGVHLGHQKILRRLKEVAEHCNGETVVLTYWPHPRMVLDPDSNIKLLSTLEEKQALLEEQGVDHLLVLPFTRDFSRLSSEEFIQKVLVSGIGTRKLVIGYDHKFGRNREGSFESLKKDAPVYGFKVEEIPRQDVDDTAVSSTRIRKALNEGSVRIAGEYLGRFYSLAGKVVEGDRLGRTIGYPTANIEPEESFKLVPAQGVYAVTIEVDQTSYGGMLSIGTRPTVGGKKVTIEVNIFGLEADLYDKSIRVFFIHFIRPEEHYENIETLKKQLEQDREDAHWYLKQEGVGS